VEDTSGVSKLAHARGQWWIEDHIEEEEQTTADNRIWHVRELDGGGGIGQPADIDEQVKPMKFT
jgi:hypothetical protein